MLLNNYIEISYIDRYKTYSQKKIVFNSKKREHKITINRFFLRKEIQNNDQNDYDFDRYFESVSRKKKSQEKSVSTKTSFAVIPTFLYISLFNCIKKQTFPNIFNVSSFEQILITETKFLYAFTA